MKKTLKNFLLLFALVFSAVAVSSCSKDSENDENGSGNNNGGDATTTSGTVKLLNKTGKVNYCYWSLINECEDYFEIWFLSYDRANGETPNGEETAAVISFHAPVPSKKELPTGQFDADGSVWILTGEEEERLQFESVAHGCGKLAISKSGNDYTITINPLKGEVFKDNKYVEVNTSFTYKGSVKMDEWWECEEQQ